MRQDSLEVSRSLREAMRIGLGELTELRGASFKPVGEHRRATIVTPERLHGFSIGSESYSLEAVPMWQRILYLIMGVHGANQR